MLHPDTSGIEEIDLHINELEPQSGPGPSHFHEKALNIYLVLDGSIRVALPDGPIVLEQDELLSIPPGVVHETSNPGEKTARFVEIYLPAGDDFHIVGTLDG